MPKRGRLLRYQSFQTRELKREGLSKRTFCPAAGYESALSGTKRRMSEAPQAAERGLRKMEGGEDALDEYDYDVLIEHMQALASAGDGCDGRRLRIDEDPKYDMDREICALVTSILVT